MRAEVPDDAHVGLVQPEVHAARRDEVDLAELAGIDQLADRDDRRAVEERVARHQHEPALARRGAISSTHSADEAASGFSTKTCLPASSAAAASGKWVETGVAIATASIVVVVEHLLEVARRARRRVAPRDRSSARGRESQIATSSASRRARGGSARGSGPSSRGRRRADSHRTRRRCAGRQVVLLAASEECERRAESSLRSSPSDQPRA